MLEKTLSKIFEEHLLSIDPINADRLAPLVQKIFTTTVTDWLIFFVIIAKTKSNGDKALYAFFFNIKDNIAHEDLVRDAT